METFERTANTEEVDVVAEQVVAEVAQNANTVPFETATEPVAPETHSSKVVEPEVIDAEELPDFMRD